MPTPILILAPFLVEDPGQKSTWRDLFVLAVDLRWFEQAWPACPR